MRHKSETSHIENDLMPAKESRIKRYAPAIFWGAVIALPAMNMGAAYFGMKGAQAELEIAKMKDLADRVAEAATQQ